MTADEIFAQMRRTLDLIRCAEIEREEAKRTVLVPGPASAVKLEAWLIAHGLDDVITVEMSQVLPADTYVVVDEQALEASTAEALQHYRPTFAEPRSCPRCMWPVGTGHSLTCPISVYTWGMSTVSPSSLIRVTGA